MPAQPCPEVDLMRMTYNIPIARAATAQLDHLVQNRALLPVSTVPTGCQGRAYQSVTAPQIRSLWQVMLGGQGVPTEVFRLPSAALQVLAAGVPDLIPPGLPLLETMLAQGAGRDWWAQVTGMVQAPDDVQLLLPTPLLQTVCWQPNATVWTRSAYGWTLTLAFEGTTHWPPGPHDRVIGVDVGAQPLAVLSRSAGYLTVPGIPLPAAGQALNQLPPEVAAATRRLSRAAVYGVARRRWETLLAATLPLASVVAVESLDPRSLHGRFRQQCADLAIQDALLSWLPQLACEAGVQVVRVEPALTSQTCARCLRHGNRQGELFHCPVHGTVNSHQNAADLVAVLGAAQLVGQRQARAAARRGA